MSGPDTSTMSPDELETYMNGPAYPPPAGITPNFVDPPNNNAAAIATMGVYLGLMVRVHDLMTHGGYFVHQWDLQIKQMPEYFRLYKQAVILYYFSAMLVRQAILLQWIKIFVPRGSHNAFFWTCHVIFWINTIFYIATIIVNIFPWGSHTKPLGIATASMNMVIDVVILFLPQRVIWNLNMSFRKKIGVSIVFSLGVLACASATARVIVISMRYTERSSPAMPQEQNIYLSLVALLSTAETTLGLLVFTVTGLPKALNSIGLTNLPSLVKEWLSSFKSQKDPYYNVEERDQVHLVRLESP
ncbi:hypothetical protein DL767_003306 [Monosporascus sp. MG133]|nr:hypothetical protein DL767_003306 [Monosporascus sp. MG133]